MKRLTIVTGLSGSGKSVALHTLEDEGFYCIDNLPGEVIVEMLDKLVETNLELYDRLAIGIDMRSERNTTHGLISLLRTLKTRPNVTTEILFLDTDRSTLVTRFSETRRRHPLSTHAVPLITAIDQEARLLDGVKAEADLVIDTTDLNVHELRDIVRTWFIGEVSAGLSLIFQSFGFKHGTPASTDFIFDVRCLPNPHWEIELRPHTGREDCVVEYLQKHQSVQDMLDNIQTFLAHWLPEFSKENRAYLTISVGCTGGRHRSVYLVERLAAHFNSLADNVSIRHRELR